METTPSGVALLTRAGCHSCTHASAVLREVCAEFGVDVTVIDVDEAAAESPDLRAEYGDRVPVVLLDGVEHSYWEVDVPRLRADLDRAGHPKNV
ncbi:glutaredoxin family protein [Rhodococcus sp. IEGM 1354]|uniref:glutaredoxin family protein n=1 Tax=Rhodococcus sp. IEGM 1354 TaxID=3047088 RepID=UPI0024B6B617|nr:glutaredoxin family protein [Rhodococcus sp. IEGM 1354]MDI9931629.1 glutaredoxin family protein [Rhodococcus sp. IEGM 1354]